MKNSTLKIIALFCFVFFTVGLIFLVMSHTSSTKSKPILISIDTSITSNRLIPETLVGIFFEEINHAGVGGLWPEYVMNKGFEAGWGHSPLNIDPWVVIGDEHSVSVEMDFSSCFENNKAALRINVLCDQNNCPIEGVGIYNPGFGGMNIEEGKKYKVTLYARSSAALDLFVSFTGHNQVLASAYFRVNASLAAKDWTKLEATLAANATHRNASLRITTNKRGTLWVDQVSAMPVETYLGHGFRKDLMQMLINLKPRFLRFPGGCFVEGVVLENSFQWKKTIGPWEERPGHYGDVWGYWTDDSLGYLEFLQLAEDLNAAPIWVVNAGIAHTEQVNGSLVDPYVQEMLDGLEFARGHTSSRWGSLRAKYGHPEPFDLKYVAVGNENCGEQYTSAQGNYLKFYHALKTEYPDIQVINNCDPPNRKWPDVPADMFEFHTYLDPEWMFRNAHLFDNKPRSHWKVHVSEYAVREYGDNYNGTLKGALAEAAFLIGLERNSDMISMASYAPLLMHSNDRKWMPAAIIFDNWQAFGIPSYWMQTFFTESSGGTLLDLKQSTEDHSIASAIQYKSDGKEYIKVKVVNFRSRSVEVIVSLNGVQSNATVKGSKQTILTSEDPNDCNTFENPSKVIPRTSSLEMEGNNFTITLKPYSLSSFELALI